MNFLNYKLINLIIILTLICILCVTIITNIENFVWLFVLSVILLYSFYTRRKSNKSLLFIKFEKLLIIIDILVIYFISMLDMSRVSQTYFYILIIDVVIFYSARYSMISSIIIYMCYIFVRFERYVKWNSFDFWYFAPAIYEDLFYFIFVFVIVYIAKIQVNQGQVLVDTMKELQLKKNNLETSNKKLNEVMKNLEELTALKERNRIAREIHDTVGHTLTTVIIEIEAGKRLLGKNMILAKEKLDLAQEQVRKGLNDIRHSVHTLEEGSGLLEFIPSVQSLIKDTEMHTGVKIVCEVQEDGLQLTSEQGKVLFNALQEGLTNGIKHGQCTAFFFSLKTEDNQIIFLLRDNGSGCDNMLPGFGLTAMKERVEEIFGNLEINTSYGQGFCLKIQIPVKKGELYEYYKNSDSRRPNLDV